MTTKFCETPKAALDLAAHISGVLDIGTIASLAEPVRVFLAGLHFPGPFWDVTSDAITGAVAITITAGQSDLLRAGVIYRLYVFSHASGSLEPVTANGITAESISIQFVNVCPVPDAPHTLTIYNQETCPPEDCGC